MPRPKSPTALTQAQRRAKAQADLLARGGRVVAGPLLIQPVAAAALEALTLEHGTQAAAINAALQAYRPPPKPLW